MDLSFWSGNTRITNPNKAMKMAKQRIFHPIFRKKETKSRPQHKQQPKGVRMPVQLAKQLQHFSKQQNKPNIQLKSLSKRPNTNSRIGLKGVYSKKKRNGRITRMKTFKSGNLAKGIHER